MSGQRTQDTPMAIDLANWLESVSTGLSANQAATELRRLHAESEKLEAERTARMATQIENEELKARLARSGVAHRQVVAVLTNALRHIEGVALAGEPRDLPGIAQAAREALDHWAIQKGEA